MVPQKHATRFAAHASGLDFEALFFFFTTWDQAIAVCRSERQLMPPASIGTAR